MTKEKKKCKTEEETARLEAERLVEEKRKAEEEAERKRARA